MRVLSVGVDHGALITPDREIRLTIAEAVVLQLLANGKPVSTRELLRAVYGPVVARNDTNDELDEHWQFFHHFLHGLWRRIECTGLSTKYTPGSGWRLSGPIKRIDIVSRRGARRVKLKGACR